MGASTGKADFALFALLPQDSALLLYSRKERCRSTLEQISLGCANNITSSPLAKLE